MGSLNYSIIRGEILEGCFTTGLYAVAFAVVAAAVGRGVVQIFPSFPRGSKVPTDGTFRVDDESFPLVVSLLQSRRLNTPPVPEWRVFDRDKESSSPSFSGCAERSRTRPYRILSRHEHSKQS